MAELASIALSEVLEELRQELSSAAAKAAMEEVRFPIESVTVELKVGVTKADGAKAGFRVPLIGAELSGSVGFGRESTHTLTLVLGPPVDREGTPIKVGSATAEQKAN